MDLYDLKADPELDERGIWFISLSFSSENVLKGAFSLNLTSTNLILSPFLHKLPLIFSVFPLSGLCYRHYGLSPTLLTTEKKVKWYFLIASKWPTMLQNHALIGLFLIFDLFPAQNRGFIATGSRKTSALKQRQLIPVWRKTGQSKLKLLANNPVFSGFHSGRPEIHEQWCIDPDLREEYINIGLNEELLPVLLPVLRHKSFAKSVCQGHILNGCCAKLASNLDANVGLLILWL